MLLLNLQAMKPPREVIQYSGSFRVTKTSHSKLTQLLSIWTVARPLVFIFLSGTWWPCSSPGRVMGSRNPGFRQSPGADLPMGIYEGLGSDRPASRTGFMVSCFPRYVTIWKNLAKATPGTFLPSLRKNKYLYYLPYRDYLQQGRNKSPKWNRDADRKRGWCWVINLNKDPL